VPSRRRLCSTSAKIAGGMAALTFMGVGPVVAEVVAVNQLVGDGDGERLEPGTPPAGAHLEAVQVAVGPTERCLQDRLQTSQGDPGRYLEPPDRRPHTAQ